MCEIYFPWSWEYMIGIRSIWTHPDSAINFPRPYGRGISLFQTSFALRLFYPGVQCTLV